MKWLLILLTAFANAAPVSFSSAYQSALKKNELMGISRADQKVAHEARRGILGNVLPKITLNGNYTRQDTGSSSLLKQDASYARFTLTQPLFHGLSDIYVYRSYLALEESATAKEVGTRLDLYTKVAEVYYGALSAQADEEHLKALLTLTEKRVNEIKSRTKIGRSKKGDLLSAQAQAASLRAQVEAATTEKETTFENFLTVTGLERDSKLEADPLPQAPHIASLDLLLNMIDKRPDIEAAKQTFESKSNLVTAAKGKHWPSIDFSGNYYLHRTGSLSDSKWDVGLTASLPLFEGFSTDAAIDEAIAERAKAELALAKLRREATAEIRNLFKTFSSIVAQVKILNEANTIAEANYQEQQMDYRYGLVGNIDVLQSMNLLQDIKRNLDRAHYQSKIAHIKILAAAGQLPEIPK